MCQMKPCADVRDVAHDEVLPSLSCSDKSIAFFHMRVRVRCRFSSIRHQVGVSAKFASYDQNTAQSGSCVPNRNLERLKTIAQKEITEVNFGGKFPATPVGLRFRSLQRSVSRGSMGVAAGLPGPILAVGGQGRAAIALPMVGWLDEAD
jgi:hypothetical protein